MFRYSIPGKRLVTTILRHKTPSITTAATSKYFHGTKTYIYFINPEIIEGNTEFEH